MKHHLRSNGGDGENSGPQPFPATAPEDCCGAKSPPLASAPGPLATSDVGKALGGCPTECALCSGSASSIQP
ncbi:hypothetical protein JOB18_041704 [Solea senegalensis]|uniref:Uncharacterized protein n=1 Tax=Solea senegalensis TaxID=28829 RepID=A0AAV6PZI8_SOLSE|nr:hypothetical protein JOB18_041704 [Solea senegalensis]